jgi:hypothetical protein
MNRRVTEDMKRSDLNLNTMSVVVKIEPISPHDNHTCAASIPLVTKDAYSDVRRASCWTEWFFLYNHWKGCSHSLCRISFFRFRMQDI